MLIILIIKILVQTINFNNIYLNTFATDSIKPDSLQWIDIDNMSELNASENGEAVYWARAAKKSYKEDEFTNLRKGILQGDMQSLPKFLIIPNPASQTITITCSDKNNQIFDIEIFDITGQLIMHDRSLKSEQEFQINVLDLVNGNYLIKISSSSTNAYYSKLIIIR